MVLRLLGMFLILALGGVLGQDGFPGVFGKITSRPKAGDLAPEINFSKVLHDAGSEPWTTARLSGQVTVLFPFPYVSGNLNLVNDWNTLVGQFTGKPVQFAWITGEKESTLLPFLQEHPINGWVFHDPDGGTGRSYGLEVPQVIIIGPNRTIIGFDRGILIPSNDLINGVLDDRITILPPKPTIEQLRTLSEEGRPRLWSEPQQMPRTEDHRPDFPPSYTVHIAPAHDRLNGGNYAGDDYWSLQGYTVRKLLAEMLGVNPIRVDLPASIDPNTRYDFAIVLPKAEETESKRSLIRQGVEDHFHLVDTRENLLRNVYLVTATDKRPPTSAFEPHADGGSFSSSSFVGFTESGGLDGVPREGGHDLNALTDIGIAGATVDDFCTLLEQELDRPVINETKLDGTFDFEVKIPEHSPQAALKHDFVERVLQQLGLVIAPAQRSVDTIVYRLR